MDGHSYNDQLDLIYEEIQLRKAQQMASCDYQDLAKIGRARIALHEANIRKGFGPDPYSKSLHVWELENG